MNRHRTMLASALMVIIFAAAPASALNDPLVVVLKPVSGTRGGASATLFGTGSTVLVNIKGDSGVPNGAAVTLNDGDCRNPGGVAFSLSRYNGGSMTRLSNTLSEIAGKAKSMVIHQSGSETSKPLACGKLADT